MAHGFIDGNSPVGKVRAFTMDELLEASQRLRALFDTPGLTGVWCYRRKDKEPKWCATVITGDGVTDTEDFDSPWEALQAAADLR